MPIGRAARKTRHRGPLEKFYDEAAFLGSVAGAQENQDPLAEDWNWVRGPMAALVDVAREFGARYAAAKRELAALDFHDLEQFALRLLWDQAGSAPTDLARRWQQQLRHILVDEVQDINPAQDRILTALAREGAESNRFLVGDVKQSIYRFRLADPRIFQNYAREWAASGTPPAPFEGHAW
jgi:ATP-dependent helicase/nuclease subunit A